MILNLMMNEPEHYYCMPPVGMTETRSRVGTITNLQYTIRCGDKNCWFVGHAATSPDAQTLLDNHECPSPPARNELPSGFSTVEKLWDELDDVMAAIMSSDGYNAGTQTLYGDQLRGYARGLSFALSMMTHPHFRTITEIAKEAAKRHKIRTKKIPFEPTPGYKYNPVTPASPPVGEKSAFHGPTKPATKAAPRKAQPRKVVKEQLKKIDMSSLSIQQSEQIKMAHSMGMFTTEELAQTYGVTVETVEFLVGKTV